MLDDEHSTYFVQPDSVGSRIPRLEHVQDTVVHVISEPHVGITGYDATFAEMTGRLYSEYRRRREEARKLLKVRSEKDNADVTDKSLLLSDTAQSLEGWERERIIKDLEALHIDADKAEEIAKEVERVLLKSGLHSVSSELITELVNNELVNRGMRERIDSTKGFQVSEDFINGLIREKTVENSNIVANNPEAASFDIANVVWKQYALKNIFSPDVVKAHSTGAIHLHDLNFPTRGYQFSGDTKVVVNGEEKTLKEIWDSLDVEEQQLNETQYAKFVEGLSLPCGDKQVEVEKLVLSKETKPAKRITLADGRVIKVTDEHGVPVLRDGKHLLVRADELLSTDRIIVSKAEDKKQVLNEDYVVCPVCGGKFRCLNAHVVTHGLTTTQFMEQFPLNPVVCQAAHILNVREKKVSSYSQTKLFEYFEKVFPDEVMAEYPLGSCYIDIAFPSSKLAIKVDGRFHHGEGNSAIQQRVRRNDERKNKVIATLDWQLIRVPEDQLYENPSEPVGRIYAALGVEPQEDLTSIDLMPELVKKCELCGKPLTMDQIQAGHVHCSNECKNRDFYVKGRCSNCYKVGAPIHERGYRFCSEECRDSFLATHLEDRSVCLNCGKPIFSIPSVIPVFCDKKCQLEYIASHPEYRRNLSANSDYNKKRRAEGRVDVVCANCGKEFWVHRKNTKNNLSGNYFCCSACYHAFSKGKPRH